MPSLRPLLYVVYEKHGNSAVKGDAALFAHTFGCSVFAYPFNITLPPNFFAGMLFLISIVLGFLVLISFSMLIYISAFYTLSPMGIRMLATSVIEFFAGAVIPLPFFPEALQPVMYALPFASMQNTPFMIYVGHISGSEIVKSMVLQVIWLAVLVIAGRLLMKHALKKVVVQGG